MRYREPANSGRQADTQNPRTLCPTYARGECSHTSDPRSEYPRGDYPHTSHPQSERTKIKGRTPAGWHERQRTSMTGTITKYRKKNGKYSWGYVFDTGDAGKRNQKTKQG